MVTLVAVVSVTMGVPGGFGRAAGQKDATITAKVTQA